MNWIPLALIALALIAGAWGRARARKAKAERLAARWGADDAPHRLDADELHDIGAYCRARSGAQPCAVDEITWNDLDMDAVFEALDRAASGVGEEALYDMLHRTDASEEALARRRRIREAMSADNAPHRTSARAALARLGRGRFHGAHRFLFEPQLRRPAHGWAYPVLGVAPLLCLTLGIAVHPGFLLAMLAALTVNIVVYYRSSKSFMREIAAVRHIAAVIETARRLCACLPPELSDIAGALRDQTEELRPVRRWSALFAMQRVNDFDFLTDYLRFFFQLDMICLCRLTDCFVRKNGTLRALYAQVGEIDACMAAASFAASRETVCTPEFAADMRVTARGLTHPLIEHAVGNDLSWERPILITGSNASGKSTFIKAMAVNAILAQTLGLCTAASMRMPRARVMTSMALRDNVRGGESYFVVEVRSLRRILDAAVSGEPLLCMIDEILRGTNTAERIAASRALLTALDRPNCLCMAATHDQELTRLLERYRQMHFREELTQGGMTFPYRLMEGPSTTRNALALMRQMGFPEELVARAEADAGRLGAGEN